MSNAARFKQAFSPYGQRYSIQDDNGLFGGQWSTIDRPLTDSTIERAILGRIVVAYILTTFPRAIGLDIDDHKGYGTGYVLDILDQITARLGGMKPSVLAASPRGLHPFYFLSTPTPWQFLEGALRESLQGIAVEIRPTPNTSLRIPSAASFIDPQSFRYDARPYEDIIDSAERVHPAELFNEGILPGAIRTSLRERKERFGLLRSAVNLGRIEARYSPIMAGNTNEALCKLIPCYRGAGMDSEQAAVQFTRLLAPNYTGELNDWHRLHKRIESLYKNTPTAYEGARNVQLDLFTSEASAAIASLWTPDKVQGRGAYHVGLKREGIRELVAGIVNWRGHIDMVKASPTTRASYNYVYPYFLKNTHEGYYPLPNSVLRKADLNYNRFMPFLESIGFLEPAPYPYVPNAGICRYYRINSERFVNKA